MPVTAAGMLAVRGSWRRPIASRTPPRRVPIRADSQSNASLRPNPPGRGAAAAGEAGHPLLQVERVGPTTHIPAPILHADEQRPTRHICEGNPPPERRARRWRGRSLGTVSAGTPG